MRHAITPIGLSILGLILGFVLVQYSSGGMVLAFLQKLPGCL